MEDRLGIDDAVSAALLVTDMQNAFLEPEGSFARMTRGTELSIDMCRAAIPVCVDLIEAARATRLPVIHTKYVYQPGYADRDVLFAKYPMMEEYGSLLAGSWDAETVDDLRPAADDFVIEKSRYSAFVGTRLEPLLTGLGVRNLFICGVTTNVCVETTARDAAMRQFKVFVVSDATGEFTAERHANALDILEYGFAWVGESHEVITAWSHAAESENVTAERRTGARDLADEV